MVALSSIKAEYIILTLAAKEIIWLYLLLTELGLFQSHDQYAKIFIKERNSHIKALLGEDMI